MFTVPDGWRPTFWSRCATSLCGKDTVRAVLPWRCWRAWPHRRAAYEISPRPRDYSGASDRKAQGRSSSEPLDWVLDLSVARPRPRSPSFHASFGYQTGSWNYKRRVVAKVDLAHRRGGGSPSYTRPTRADTTTLDQDGWRRPRRITEAVDAAHRRQERHQPDPSVMCKFRNNAVRLSASRSGPTIWATS